MFIGDELAAQDLEFVVANKVTRVINCCGRQVPNHWEPIGVIYLTYFWNDADNQTVLDPRDVVANEIFRFIEEALEGAESVLIHSVRGQSRSCCVLSAYMMKKYNWGLRKTMEFLSSRRPDLNLKPSFLQQLSGYERRLMAQSRIPFSLDWNDADFSRLESEDLLLRNTYINSQMGPLAEFHAGDMSLQGKPRKLMWNDNNTDDKLRLEKPAGADKHNLQNCKRNPMGQQILKSVLKVPKHQPQRNKENNSLMARATSNENPQEAQPQPAPLAQMVPGAPPAALGPNVQGQMSMPQAPFQPNPAPLEAREMVPQAFMHSVQTAWGESDRPMAGAGGNGLAPGLGSGYPDPAQQSAYGYQVGAPVRAPANNIRDSLCGLNRKESPDPGDRRAASRDSLVQSRDPSPAENRRASGSSANSKRDSPMAYRGESPLRLLSRSGRGSSPAVPSAVEKSKQHTNGTGGYNPQIGQLGFCLGGIRAGSSGGPPNPQGNVVPGNGAPQRGIDAFRSVRAGGPVRAKADLLGAGAEGGNSSLRRSRPQTAPTQRANSGSRPSSPLGQSNNRASGSRPSSPQTRPSSPGQSVQSKPAPQAAYPQAYPLTQLEKTKHRSLSSHMRRAPSPTPAFNRNPSPSRPRWRM